MANDEQENEISMINYDKVVYSKDGQDVENQNQQQSVVEMNAENLRHTRNGSSMKLWVRTF